MVHPQRLSLYTVILKGTCYIGFEVLDVQEYMNTFTVNSKQTTDDTHNAHAPAEIKLLGNELCHTRYTYQHIA